MLYQVKEVVSPWLSEAAFRKLMLLVIATTGVEFSFCDVASSHNMHCVLTLSLSLSPSLVPKTLPYMGIELSSSGGAHYLITSMALYRSSTLPLLFVLENDLNSSKKNIPAQFPRQPSIQTGGSKWLRASSSACVGGHYSS